MAFLDVRPQEGLNVEGLVSSDMLEVCKSQWLGIQERKKAPQCIESVLELLRSKGFSTEYSAMLEEVPLSVSTAIKNGMEGEKYVVEMVMPGSHRSSTNYPTALRARHRWRFQLFSALNYGIICLDKEHYLTLKSSSEQESYIMENIYPAGKIPLSLPLHHTSPTESQEATEGDGEKDDDVDPWAHEDEELDGDIPEDYMSQDQTTEGSASVDLEVAGGPGSLHP